MKMIVGMLIEGVALAAIWIVIALVARPRIAKYGHALILVVAAVFYIGFALEAGDYTGLAIEIVGTTAFAAMAWKGLRYPSGALLALGFALHPLWDVGLHTGSLGEYAPLSYVVICISFDWLLAAFIWRTLPGSDGATSAVKRIRLRPKTATQ